MAKLKKPLLSLGARGGLGKAISFVKRGGRSIAEKKPEIPDARTLAQLSWRHMYQKAVALWHALSAAEKQEWESLARPKHMTGFAWFISQALKPNPGLYLPLQGGTMAGEIDMDGQGIKDLPDPTQDQDAATKKYHDDNLPAGPYTQGCRVYHDANQQTTSGAYLTLHFNSEDYDTDGMHDLVVTNERVYIKTAGIYLLVFHGEFAANPTGYRTALITRDGVTIVSRYDCNNVSGTYTSLFLTTLIQCAALIYFQVSVYQNSGAFLDIRRTADYSPYFMAQRVG